jgi:pimeloyl-ACP methyl ester carboxylesterase
MDLYSYATRAIDAVTGRWLTPVRTQPEIRRDTDKVLRAIAANRRLLVDTAERLPSFDRPALVAWASEDRVMPPEHGRRLAELLPHGRLIEIPDSYTLVPLDQPAALADAIERFVRRTARVP